MSRKRYISTDLSTDSKIAELSEHGYLPIILYTWSIPHMDDWGRITGDARQFKLLVCPGFDATVKEINDCLDLVASVGLWERYEVDGKKCISISSDRWFKHQSYINKSKRDDDSGSNYPNPDKKQETPQNTEEHLELPKITEEQQEEPKNPVSFSSSVSSSPSVTKTNTFDDCSSNTDLVKTLKSFEEFRKKIKKPLTEKAKEILLRELAKLTSDDNEKISILEQSIVNGWQGVFALKDSRGSSTVARTGQASYRKDNNQNGINKGQIVGIVPGTDIGF